MTDEYRVDKNFDIIKRSENNIILFGEVGTGKTTIINKLCEVNLLTKGGGYSCTRDVQFATTKDNNLIIDFPGLSAAEEVVRHLKIQKSTLSVIPVRIICFIIKYDRYDLIQKKAVQMLKIFFEHKDNICIIITFSEKANETHKSEIQFLFKTKFKIENKNVIFSSQSTTSSELLNKLNIIKNSVQNIDSIKFSERHLINSAGVEGVAMEIIEEREKYLNKYSKAVELFRNEFTKATDYSLKFALYYSFRDYKDNLIDSFSELVKKTVTDTDSAIVEIITFNNELYDPFNKITERFEKEMKIESVTFNGGNDNRYKKCPNCGRIWFKIKGCNSMRCGNRTKRKDIFFGMFKTYLVKFTGEIFNITTLQENKTDEGIDSAFFGPTEEENNLNKSRGNKHLISPEGCGSSLNWATIEDVTDKVLEELKKTYSDNTYDLKMKEKLNNINIII
jgi:GTP-binding protein EngB required for normal cell division